MQVAPKQVFNLWDTNGRRHDVLNALEIYLEVLREIRAEHPGELWAAYPNSVAQFVFYQKAIERSPEVFKAHPKYDRFLEKLGAKLPAFLDRGARFALSEKDREVLDNAIEARARHYTSNLVKMGLADSQRRESAVGTAFLNASVNRDSLEEVLPINDTNLLLLRQLLKLRIYSKPVDGVRTFYAPCAMALLLLLSNDAVDHSTFVTVVQGLDPYLSKEEWAAVLANIKAPAAIEEQLLQTKVDVPEAFCADGIVPPEVFAAHIKNQKTASRVEIYYRFYEALYRFRAQRDADAYQALTEILIDNKDTLQKAFGCGRAIFDVGHGRTLTVDEFLKKNSKHAFLAGGAFNREFYLAYSRSARADDVREYSDTTERLLGATGLFKFDPLPELASKELLALIFREDVLIENLFGTESEEAYRAYEEAPEGPFMSNRTLAEILRYDYTQVNDKVAKMEAFFGVTGQQKIRNTVQSKIRNDFIRHIETKYTKECVLDLLALFTDRRNDAKIKKAVNDTASVPTIYEFIVGIAWYYISGKDFDLYSSLKLTMNADFEPISHASGGDGDIVIHYDDLAVMLEATLMNKQAQKRGEWEPVLRHSLNLKAGVEPKDAITFFVADELDYNTINIWRAVAAATLESTNTHKPVNGAVIMPFTTEELAEMLERDVPAVTIIDTVRQSFAKVPPNTNTDWKEEIMEQLLPAQ